jgi:hypothetical protein
MLELLIDENFNHRIVRGLRRSLPEVDYLIAQDVGLRGVDDPSLLAWAADQRRILVTHDLKTIPKHAYHRVRAGRVMPGVIAVPDTLPIGKAVDDLVLIAECGQTEDFDRLVAYLPLR